MDDDPERLYRKTYVAWLLLERRRLSLNEEALQATERAAAAWHRLTELAGKLPPEVREALSREQFP